MYNNRGAHVREKEVGPLLGCAEVVVLGLDKRLEWPRDGRARRRGHAKKERRLLPARDTQYVRVTPSDMRASNAARGQTVLEP